MEANGSDKVRLHNIGLSQELNPEYFRLFEEHNKIRNRWNDINKEIHLFKQPKFFLCRQKSKFKKLYGPMEELQKSFLEWNKDVENFLTEPKLKFKRDQESEIGFPHFISLLTDLKNTLDSHMVLIADNFVKIQNRHSSQVNFIIAIISALISTAGLIIAIYTILK
jgi:hypothetical protein